MSRLWILNETLFFNFAKSDSYDSRADAYPLESTCVCMRCLNTCTLLFGIDADRSDQILVGRLDEIYTFHILFVALLVKISIEKFLDDTFVFATSRNV